MSIKATKTVNPPLSSHSGFSLQVVFFAPKFGSSPSQPVTTIADLHSFLGPYLTKDKLAIFLDRAGGESGAVWVHLSGDRAWVTHFTEMGGVDSYACDLEYNGPDELIGFLLDNRQLDEIHRYWTITKAEGLHALEYFLQHGENSPQLNWVSEPESLQTPNQQGS